MEEEMIHIDMPKKDFAAIVKSMAEVDTDILLAELMLWRHRTYGEMKALIVRLIDENPGINSSELWAKTEVSTELYLIYKEAREQLIKERAIKILKGKHGSKMHYWKDHVVQ